MTSDLFIRANRSYGPAVSAAAATQWAEFGVWRAQNG